MPGNRCLSPSLDRQVCAFPDFQFEKENQIQFLKRPLEAGIRRGQIPIKSYQKSNFMFIVLLFIYDVCVCGLPW